MHDPNSHLTRLKLKSESNLTLKQPSAEGPLLWESGEVSVYSKEIEYNIWADWIREETRDGLWVPLFIVADGGFSHGLTDIHCLTGRVREDADCVTAEQLTSRSSCTSVLSLSFSAWALDATDRLMVTSVCSSNMRPM